MEDYDGRELLTVQEIGNCVSHYFSQLFQSSEPAEDAITEIVEGIERRISSQMNQAISLDYNASEVYSALKYMSPLKAPGPDSMPALFYQKYWGIVGTEITALVLNFLNNGIIPEGLNHTNIALIPKIKNAKHISHYRPISLCNVVYKIA